MAFHFLTLNDTAFQFYMNVRKPSCSFNDELYMTAFDVKNSHVGYSSYFNDKKEKRVKLKKCLSNR